MNASSPPQGFSSAFRNSASALGTTRLARGAAVVGLLGILAALLWASLLLAAGRLYQVDECTEVYVARTLVTAGGKAACGPISLFQIALSWFVRDPAHAADVLASARLVMVQIFWINWLLIALGTGERLLSCRGLIALASAATLAPLWDYGFEVRHDNVLLAGVLVSWGLARFRPPTIRSCATVGALAVVLEFCALNAFVYTLPISMAMLFLPHAGTRTSRVRLILAWTSGAAGAFAALRLALGAAGLWKPCAGAFMFLTTVSIRGQRFAAWGTLSRLLLQTPLMLALVLAGLITMMLELKRRGKAALTWEGNLPEALLCLGAFAALVINPTPYPYNLLQVAPFAFILAFRSVSGLFKESQPLTGLLPVMVSILVFLHVVPFGIATRRHWSWPNTQQESVMRLAESLTDPVKDPVYDGVGMVSTRPVVHPQAFLHSLNMQRFLNGPGPKLRDMLAARPPAVIVPNYRTDWLPKADHDFIESHYVSLADDLWVLGKVLPAGGGAFDVIHPGRYRIAPREASDLAGTYPLDMASLAAPPLKLDLPGTLDGQPITGKPVDLAVGTHRVECPGKFEPAVLWLGPKFERLPRVGGANHRNLFVNWY